MREREKGSLALEPNVSCRHGKDWYHGGYTEPVLEIRIESITGRFVVMGTGKLCLEVLRKKSDMVRREVNAECLTSCAVIKKFHGNRWPTPCRKKMQ